MCEQGGDCDPVGTIDTWDNFDVGNLNYLVPEDLEGTDYYLQLSAPCFSEIVSDNFPIVTFNNDEVSLSASDTAPASYQSLDGSIIDWMQNGLNTLNLTFNSPLTHIPVEIWDCVGNCGQCENDIYDDSSLFPTTSGFTKLGDEYLSSTAPATLAVDVRVTGAAGNHCILPALKGQSRNGCSKYSGVDVTIHAWADDTITKTDPTQDTFDPACGVSYIFSLTHKPNDSHTQKIIRC